MHPTHQDVFKAKTQTTTRVLDLVPAACCSEKQISRLTGYFNCALNNEIVLMHANFSRVNPESTSRSKFASCSSAKSFVLMILRLLYSAHLLPLRKCCCCNRLDSLQSHSVAFVKLSDTNRCLINGADRRRCQVTRHQDDEPRTFYNDS